MGSDTLTVSVENVAPTAEAGDGAIVAEDALFVGSGWFSDPGTDSWTATVDYGDGSGLQPLTLAADNTFALSHTYLDDGTYTVTVCVTDDDGGVGSDQLTVQVLPRHRYEQTDARLSFSGSWASAYNVNASAGGYKYSNAPGASLILKFRGIGVDYVATRTASQGWVRLTLDGNAPELVNLYSPVTLYQHKVWSASDLAPGEHTLLIERTGTPGTPYRGGAIVNVEPSRWWASF